MRGRVGKDSSLRLKSTAAWGDKGKTEMWEQEYDKVKGVGEVGSNGLGWEDNTQTQIYSSLG